MYGIGYRENVEEKILKMGKKDKQQLFAIFNKLEEIRENPQRFKPLRGPMKGQFRVHIMKSFVLTYSIDEKNKKVIVEDYAHHDNVYR